MGFLFSKSFRMRSVIRKPLTMLVAARATATPASSEIVASPDSDSTMRAAMNDTEEIALVNAMSGV